MKAQRSFRTSREVRAKRKAATEGVNMLEREPVDAHAIRRETPKREKKTNGGGWSTQGEDLM